MAAACTTAASILFQVSAHLAVVSMKKWLQGAGVSTRTIIRSCKRVLNPLDLGRAAQHDTHNVKSHLIPIHPRVARVISGRVAQEALLIEVDGALRRSELGGGPCFDLDKYQRVP